MSVRERACSLFLSLFLCLFLLALHSPSQEAEPATQAAADPTLCCRIKEGDKVNVDVTAPGATLPIEGANHLGELGYAPPCPPHGVRET